MLAMDGASMGDKVTLSELARRLGWQKSYIHKLKTQGTLQFDQHGLIDEDEARRAIADNRDPAKDYMAGVNEAQREKAASGNDTTTKPEASASANATISKARTALMVTDFRRKQLEYRKSCGELVEKQELQSALVDALSTIRQQFEMIPDRLAEPLAAESDAEKCFALVNEEIQAVLSDLHKTGERIVAGAGEK